MASDRKKALSILILAVCFLPLLALFIHLWTYEYVVVDKSGADSASRNGGPLQTGQATPALPLLSLTGSMRMEHLPLLASHAKEPGATITVELSIENQGPLLGRLLYTPWPSPLLEPHLFLLGPQDKETPLPPPGEPPNTPHPAPPPLGKREVKPLRFCVAELPAGRRLNLPLTLQPPYDLSRPGKYRLKVAYRPAAFAEAESISLEALRISALNVDFPPLDFEVQELPAAALPETPANGPLPSPKP